MQFPLAKTSCHHGFLSVIIPTWNDPQGLETTLKALANQSLPRNLFEVLVVNDGGDAETSRICRLFAVLEVVLNPRGGSYAARNKGIEASLGELVGFIDSNMLPSPSWCHSGIKALQQAEYCGGLVQTQPSRGNHDDPALLLYQQMTSFPVELYLAKDHFVPTANLFVKRKVFESLGLFDSRLESGGDMELGDRVFRNGKFRQLYDPDIFATHPTRTYSELLAKEKRVFAGHGKLASLYPDRFSYMRPTFVLFFRSLLPPRRLLLSLFRSPALDLVTRLKIFTLGWAIKMCRGWHVLLAVRRNLGI